MKLLFIKRSHSTTELLVKMRIEFCPGRHEHEYFYHLLSILTLVYLAFYIFLSAYAFISVCQYVRWYNCTIFTSLCNYYNFFITVQEVPKRVEHGWPTFLWQQATPVIVGGFTCRKLKNNNSIPNHLKSCVILTVYTLFTKVARGLTIQHEGPRVVDPWCTSRT